MAVAEPSPRYGHVAAGVEGKVYVWGGTRGYQEVSHDGPDKAEIIFSVVILDVKVSIYMWQSQIEFRYYVFDNRGAKFMCDSTSKAYQT